MTRIDDLGEKFDLKNWPHRFTKTAREIQIGLDKETGDKKFAVEMTCMDCQVRFISGQQPRPPDPCPARNKNKEMRRLLS